MSLPPLAPISSLSRPLSLSEYYHASVGTSLFTLEPQREVVLVLRGQGIVTSLDWQSAIARVAAVHPGVRLRLAGRRRHARWHSDGPPPRLRIIEGCDWDAASDRGGEFLTATRLSLRKGPTIELVVAACVGGGALVILRGLHAVIDGRGGMLILAELFRALRGETLLGSNAGFSDFDFRRSVGKIPFSPQPPGAAWPVPTPTRKRTGFMFRRLSLGAPRRDMLARVTVAVAGFVHRHSDDPALIGLPVDLRAGVPGLLTTVNFCDMMTVRVDKGSSAADFQQRLRERLAHHTAHGYPDIPDRLKDLPLPVLDLLVSRHWLNYRKVRKGKTATISNLGRTDSATFAAAGFQPIDVALLPIPGDVFVTLAGLGERVEMMVGMPKAMADDACLDYFDTFVRNGLESD